MKKLLLLIITVLFVFTLSACDETDVPTLDTFTELETVVTDNEASLAALETELAALETSLAALEGQSDAADLLIANIELDIIEIEKAIYWLEFEDGETLAIIEDVQVQIDELILDLQANIDALEVELGVQVFDVQTQVNPLYMLETEVTDIVIAHTNDVHGRVNADSWAGSMGMATIKNIVDELRAAYDNTFLIDAGDILHGTTFATLEDGVSMINVMNEVGYDLMVPGNHDFNYGQDQLLVLEGLADFDMITANVQYSSDNTDFMNPYVIQDFDGVSVGFFGLTSPETVYKTHPDNVIGLNFLDPIAQATAMVTALEDEGVDLIILVAHIGLDENTAVTTEDIAIAVDGIDVIIDGHSHTVLPEGMMVGETLIVSTGEYMKNLGVFSLSVQNGEIISYEVLLVDADQAEYLAFGDDEDIQAYIDEITTAQDIILGEVVGQTAVILDGERADVRTGETNLGNIIADSMIVVTGADVAITNGGGIRDSIPAGDVTLGDIITVLPFGNIIATVDLTGQEILDTLEYATGAYPNAEGMFPHVAGMTFEIDVYAAEGSRVINLEIGGVAVNLATVYSVATNDFLAAGGDGYELFAATPITGEFMGLHEALEDMFTVDTDIAMPTMGRITVVYNSQTVASTNLRDDGTAMQVEGVITTILSDGTFTIEDADGTALYVDDYNDEIDFTALTVVVGDKVTVVGEVSHYNGINMVDAITAVTIVSSGNAITAPIAITDMAAFRTNITADDFGKRYTFTNVLIIEDAGYYVYFFEPVDGEDRMGIVTGTSDATLVVEEGEYATFTATFYGLNGSITDNTKIMRFVVEDAADYVVVTPAP